MGIYINGMEMPKEIEPALVIDFCVDLDGKRYARFYHYCYGGLTDWHEVLEFHEPHGRLIDADALKAYWQPDHDREFGVDYFIHTIEVTPTVIGAEIDAEGNAE